MSDEKVLKAINDLGKSWDTRFIKLETKVTDIDVDLRGNDKPGIKQRLKSVEDKFENVGWVTKVLVGAVILDILASVLI